MITDTPIEIVPYNDRHQPGIDAMLASIAEEYETSFFSPNSKKICEVYSLPGRYYWVATSEGEVIGCVGVIICSNDYAVLKSMFLLKTFRNTQQQIATRLLETATQCVVKSNCTRLYLGTMSQFKAAQRFYEKHGFEGVHEQDLPDNFPSNTVDTVFYKKDISRHNP